MPAPSLAQPSTWPNRLFIAIACGELAYSYFWQRLGAIHGYGWFMWKGLWASQSGQFIAQSRRTLVKEALKNPDWDRLVFLDADHGFPADMLWRHAHYTQPTVSGVYPQRRTDQPVPVFYNWNEGRQSMSRPPMSDMYDMVVRPQLYKVDVVPMGCTSIRRDVLERWPDDTPVFASLDNNEVTGEDTWFCRHAQDQGHEVYIDTSLEVDHYALIPINVKFFKQWVVHHYAQDKTA